MKKRTKKSREPLLRANWHLTIENLDSGGAFTFGTQKRFRGGSIERWLQKNRARLVQSLRALADGIERMPKKQAAEDMIDALAQLVGAEVWKRDDVLPKKRASKKGRRRKR